ncbi:MAG: hypothetical protein M1830_006822 [Pleopsidium flavum]|nr:MAG: hypothetical protein M1830_006822 [Pleopsidium flavum]
MGRNPTFDGRGLKKPPSGGGKSAGELSAEKSFPPLGQSRFPSSISKALKEECNIQFKAFAMVYLDNRGRTRFEASPAVKPSLQGIFSEDVCQRFLRAVEGKVHGRRPAQSGTAHESFQTIPEDEVHAVGLRRSSDTSSIDVRRSTHTAATRKKQNSPKPKSRASKRRKSNAKDYGASQWGAESDDDSSEDGDYLDGEVMNESIKIGDTVAVDIYFDRQFKRIQQLNCKVIAKAWIKVVEPKKQSNHPYNGGKPDSGGKADPEKTKPDWWPEGYRHKEPDHVKKNERVALLMHILRRLKHREITPERLEAATADVVNQLQPESRPLLAELYKVARFEERYLRGEIGLYRGPPFYDVETDRREQDADTEVKITVPGRISMTARGPESSVDSEEVEIPNISSPEVHMPHPSLQESSTSSLITPVNHLALQDNRQYRTSDRSRASARSHAANHAFSADPHVLNDQHRSMLNNDYHPQYTQQNAASEIQSYMETQPNNEAPSLEYMPRSAPQSFASSNSDQMVLRERGHYASLQQHQPSVAYPGWPPSAFPHHSFSNQVNYSDAPPSAHPAHQSHQQPLFQLPPPANSVSALPPLPSHQPGLPFVRIQPQYELRTGSQGHHHPHHGLPHPDFSAFSLEDKPYGE